jgi:hypothetical protein
MESLGKYHLSKMESKNLIDYLRNMCQSDQGIMISTYWNGVREKTLLCGFPINGCTQLVNQHKRQGAN